MQKNSLYELKGGSSACVLIVLPVWEVCLSWLLVPTASDNAVTIHIKFYFKSTVCRLSGLFRLTSAESRVALLLGDGKSLSEIAQLLGVSRNTLKTQVAGIYSKTGTSRQSQLVRLLALFPQSDRQLSQE